MGQTQTIGTHKTAVFSNGEHQVVKYWFTDVVKFNYKEIILNTGGWSTVTTKLRMNQASNQYNLGYNVYQKDYQWFVDYKNKTIPFNGDSITIKRNSKKI